MKFRGLMASCVSIIFSLTLCGCEPASAPTPADIPEQTETASPTPAAAAAPSPQPQAETADIEDLEQLLEKIYGEGCVVKFPLQENTYGHLWPRENADGEQELYLQPLELYKRMDDEGALPEPYTLELVKEEFQVGETIELILSNNSTDPDDVLSYGYEFYLDIQIDGVWYPLCPLGPFSGTDAHELYAGNSTTIEINSKTLARGFVLTYVEELKKYKRTIDIEREIELIPGHYRYGKSFDTKQGYFFNYCEFNIVR